MKKNLFIALVIALGSSRQANAQSEQSIMIRGGVGIIGPLCTNCGLFTGLQTTVDYGLLDKITVGGQFNYYSDKDDFGGIVYKDAVMHIGAGASFYIKERFKGFYIGPDFGLITIKSTYGVNVYKQNNFTFGANLGWDLIIADLVTINPFMGYGNWYENSKGRLEMGLRIGVKF